MDAFRESGSELALNVDRVSENNASGIANVSIAFHSQNGGGWRFTPAINIGYEHSFSGPSVRTQGQVYHYEVVQNAAFDSRDMVNAGAARLTSPAAATATATAAALAWATPFKHPQQAAAGGLLLATKLQSG